MPSLVEQLKGRNHSPLVQFIKYGIAGVAATAVQVFVFTLAARWIFPALTEKDIAVRLFHWSVPNISTNQRALNSFLDNAIGFLFSNLVAYLINVLWVFESGRHKWWVEIGSFYLVSGISMVIGGGVQWLLIEHYGNAITTTTALFASIIVSVLLNFVLRKFLIFKK